MLRYVAHIFLVALLGLSAACQSRVAAEGAGEALTSAERANVIVVVVDDLRWDELGIAGHPFLETPNIDRLARDGAWLTNAFHAVPLCSPNRASILTGQYPSRHGIIDNVARNRMSHRLETFPRALQRAGYETGFLGKWHMGNDPTPRPGFDYWSAIPGQGRSIDPELYEDGRIQTVEGYLTDVLTDRAVAFIRKKRQPDQPFFLYIGHKAIHPDAVQRDDGSVDPSGEVGYVPAPRHLGRYEEMVLPRRPSAAASPEELMDKPALRRALERKYSAEMIEAFGSILDLGTAEETIRRRTEMLLAVDESMGRIVEALDAKGILDETFIIFTSDNGFFYGEHALSLERRMPYEESIRSPFIIRYPPLIDAGSEVDELVVSVDIAPTVLDIAGAPIGNHIQGRSLIPLLQGRADDWRRSVFIEFYTYENPFPWLLDMDYRAIRTDRYKYIHWMQHPDENELYDLERDPYEMQNLIDDPQLAGVVSELRGEMRAAVLDAMGLGR